MSPIKKSPVPKPPAAPASHTYNLNAEQGTALEALLRRLGYEFKSLNYGHFSASKGRCGVHYYNSGKVVINGRDAREFIEFYFEPEITGEARLGYEEEWNPEAFAPHIGVDEAGKGDFYGPLVIAGAYLTPATARAVMKAGVRDSKRVSSDRVVRELATNIREITKGAVSVVAIGPARYNELYDKFRNLNRLLAWGHGQVIANLTAAHPDCPRALSDQFAHPSLIQSDLRRRGLSIRLEQRTKAESDPAVAAASILARAAFVEALEKLGNGTPLPKGAGAPVKAHAIELCRAQGPDALRAVAKAHFKTFGEVVRAAAA